MTWLQGGPFLEISFLLELKEHKTKIIEDIIDKLSTITYKIEMADHNIDEIIDSFNRGYLYDDEDPQSKTVHSLRFRLYVYLSRKRKVTLQIEKVSSNALMVNFWFYGSCFDALEWEQVGILEGEMTDFTNFFTELFSAYEFKVGGMALEEDVLGLFESNEEYPSESYRFENISPNYFLQEPYPFIKILWNEIYGKLSHIPFDHNRVNQDGMLITTGGFTLEP